MGVPRVVTYTGRGPRGAANYVRTDDDVTVTFHEHPQESFTFPRTEEGLWCKDVVDKVDSGIVFAEVSRDRKKLSAIRPLRGSFVGKFAGIAKPQGQPPAAKLYEGTFTNKVTGNKEGYSYEAFTALFEVTVGSWAGVVIPVFLRYNFVDAGDGETTGIKGQGKHSTMLAQFMEYSGFDLLNESIPYSENVLPWLEANLLENDESMLIVLEDGYAQSFGPAPNM